MILSLTVPLIQLSYGTIGARSGASSIRSGAPREVKHCLACLGVMELPLLQRLHQTSAHTGSIVRIAVIPRLAGVLGAHSHAALLANRWYAQWFRLGAGFEHVLGT